LEHHTALSNSLLYEGEDYLLIVDSYSHYIEIVKLKKHNKQKVTEGIKCFYHFVACVSAVLRILGC